MIRGLFITGTDTGVGKTVAAAALLHRYRGAAPLRYWKPIQTGIEQDDGKDPNGARRRAEPLQPGPSAVPDGERVRAGSAECAAAQPQSQAGRTQRTSALVGHADAQTLLTFTHGAVRPAHHVLSPPALSLSKRWKDARCRS